MLRPIGTAPLGGLPIQTHDLASSAQVITFTQNPPALATGIRLLVNQSPTVSVTHTMPTLVTQIRMDGSAALGFTSSGVLQSQSFISGSSAISFASLHASLIAYTVLGGAQSSVLVEASGWLTTNEKMAAESRIGVHADWQPLTAQILFSNVGQPPSITFTGVPPSLVTNLDMVSAVAVRISGSAALTVDPRLYASSPISALASGAMTTAIQLSNLRSPSDKVSMVGNSPILVTDIVLAAETLVWSTGSEALMTGIRLVGSGALSLSAWGHLHVPIAGLESPFTARSMRAAVTLQLGDHEYQSIKLAA